MADFTCLADGYVFPADFEKTGVNLNEMVVGGTGSGKTMSVGYPRLVHTTDSSVVVPISKGAIKNEFTQMFLDRGYEVVDLDFTHPEKGKTGYDPLRYIKTDEDIIKLATAFVGEEMSRKRDGTQDPYWNMSTISVLAAEIGLAIFEKSLMGRHATMADVVALHRSLGLKDDGDVVTTNLDGRFAMMGKNKPGSQAPELWKTFTGLSVRTASCIYSMVNNSIDKVFTAGILEIVKKPEKIDFEELGKKKIALFVTCSPVNKAVIKFVNVMYSDLFSSLFNLSESLGSRLPVPVHVICDDFACGCRIEGFEEYISIFRAAGISVTLLLQSESQLDAIYGEYGSATIINNCDTYVYMGGMDIATCRSVSERLDKPLHRVLNMPTGQVIVFRRGREPYVAKRYQILNDPVYRELKDKYKGMVSR